MLADCLPVAAVLPSGLMPAGLIGVAAAMVPVTVLQVLPVVVAEESAVAAAVRVAVLATEGVAVGRPS